MAKVLKIWHQWSWLAHICVWLVMGTAIVISFKDGVAKNTTDITEMQQQHKDENMSVRMAKQEQITQDIGQNLQEIKMVQGKIFDRINTLADKRP